MYEKLKTLYYSNNFDAIDVHFARFITGQETPINAALFLASALVSRLTRDGNVCMDLTKWAGSTVVDGHPDTMKLVGPGLTDWRRQLKHHPMVGQPGDRRPLILDASDRLYLHRYWEYESKLGDTILERAKDTVSGLNLRTAGNWLRKLLANDDVVLNHQQVLALIIAFLKRICVISGGPGTGKTYTIASIITFLLAQQQASPNRIFLVAPTGKAAMRLSEAVSSSRKALGFASDTPNGFPTQAYTIHRLLQPISNSPFFRYNADHPLPADLVVVDEASMLDLPLMAKLMQALPADARLILCGDKDQLSSVEAGSILADICGDQTDNHYASGFAEHIKALAGEHLSDAYTTVDRQSPLEDCRVFLTQTYRFKAGSDIHRFSRMVNACQPSQALKLLRHSANEGIVWKAMTSIQAMYAALAKMVVHRYTNSFNADNPVAMLKSLTRFKVLCAVRKGPWGAETINQHIEDWLDKAGLINRLAHGPWYRGRPVMVVRNHHERGLYNGDMGLALPVTSDQSTDLRVYFPGPDETVRSFLPSALPEHATAYAMTVHKSQGSEFEETVLIIPDNDVRVLTKELLYTGITRTRRQLTLWASEDSLKLTIARPVDRSSGLRDRLTHLAI